MMADFEAAKLELECAERGYAAAVEYQSKVIEQLSAANKAVNEASARETKARYALRALQIGAG
jgi:hypothetical protein